MPMDVDAVASQPNSNLSWRQGRQLLRQYVCCCCCCFQHYILYRYLNEIGYSETMLDVRSHRVRSLLGISGGGAQSQQQQQVVGGTNVER
jgi:hypothetical protein